MIAALTSDAISRTAREAELAVVIDVPFQRRHVPIRRRVAIAIAIDRSASMTDRPQATPLADAKAAAKRMIAQLDDHDEFAVVSYSTSDELVAPLRHGDAAAKAAAYAAIDAIEAAGSTCISCGLARGAAELGRRARPVGRVVLISDGQANVGITERTQPGGLAELATAMAASGVSVSTVGVGLAFDETELAQLATRSGGNFYYAANSMELTKLFATELERASRVMTRNTVLTIIDGPEARVIDAVGLEITRAGDRVRIAIPDLMEGESRTIVLRTRLAPRADTRELMAARAVLTWTHVYTGPNRRSEDTADVEVVDDEVEVAASQNAWIKHAIQRARSTRALAEVADLLARGHAVQARTMLDATIAEVAATPDLWFYEKERLAKLSGAVLARWGQEGVAKALRWSAEELARYPTSWLQIGEGNL